MTVYPFILHLGPLEITGYGLMMMVGFLVGSWLIQLELRRRGWREEYASDITLAAVIGGIVGWDPLESTCRHASLSIL